MASSNDDDGYDRWSTYRDDDICLRAHLDPIEV